MNKQEILAKYAKKFASKSNSSRPLLEGVHYAPDGTAYVTNAYYAIRIRNAHQFSIPKTLHAATGTPIEGVYPDLTKVFPSSFDNEITIGNKVFEQVLLRARCAADIATRIDKKIPKVLLTAANGSAHLQIHNGDKQIEFSAFFGNTHTVEASKRSINGEYLYTGLSVFSDANSEQIVIKLGSPLHPIVLTDEKDIDVLTLPYRAASE